MKYKVIQDVMVDGTRHLSGAEIEIHHDKTARLVMLGYIEPIMETSNRAVGLPASTSKPKTRGGKK